MSGFSIDFPTDFGSIDVKFRSPEQIKFELDGIIVSLDFGRIGPSMTRPQKEASIAQTLRLGISFEVPTRREDAMEILMKITNLFALGIGSPPSWSDIQVKFAIPSTEIDGQWADLLDRPAEVQSEDEIPWFKMLFTFGDVQKRFRDVLSSWFALTEDTRPLYTLYSAMTRLRRIPIELRLFNFFQGLESFHRMTHEVDSAIKQRADSLRKKILIACTEEERDWVQGKLQYLQEPSAQERIRTLVTEFGGEWIFEPDWVGAIKRITNLRNYFTHYSRTLRQGELRSNSIYNDGSRLQVLCEQILLIKIGFSIEEAVKLLRSKNRLDRLMIS